MSTYLPAPTTHHAAVTPATSKSYNRTRLKHRLHMMSVRLARARRLGQNPLLVLLNNPHYVKQLLPEPPLDGLSLYRQSAEKLTIPKQIMTAQTRTIMVISHC